MSKQSNYTMAVALLNFKASYENLIKAGEAMPDLDLSEAYPFYLLDYEEIAPAVAQWCTLHASELIKDLPMTIKNPACFGCTYKDAGTTPGGICVGAAQIKCNAYPEMLYQKHIATSKLMQAGIDTGSMTDDEIHFMYLNKIEKLR